ncbi:hypothetical protein N9R79_03390 [Vibrio sp.]|nr:hypothetical protein [Vibrio sp.]
MMNKVALVLCLGSLSMISGCTSTPDSTSSEVETNQASAALDMTIFNQEHDSHTLLFSSASADQLSLYNQSTYKKMIASWDQAEEVYVSIKKDPTLAYDSYSFFSDGTYLEEYNKHVAQAKTHLDQLKEQKIVSDQFLFESAEQMAYLKSIEAEKYYKSNYKTMNNLYRNLYTYVAEGDLEKASDKQVSFLETARKLEVKVLRYVHIKPLKDQINQLRSEDYNDVAPLSFNKAKRSVDQADAIVETSPRNQDKINAATGAAKFEISHTKQVVQQVKILSNIDDEAFEQYVLDVENHLLKISNAINGSDFRDKQLTQQASQILSSVNVMHSENKTDELIADLASKEAALSSLRVDNVQQQQEIVNLRDRLGNEQASSQLQIAQLEEQLVREQQSAALAYQLLESKDSSTAVVATNDDFYEAFSKELRNIPQ